MGPLPDGAFIVLVSSCFLIVGYKVGGTPRELGRRLFVAAAIDDAPLFEAEVPTAGLEPVVEGRLPILLPRALECVLLLGTGALPTGMLGPLFPGYCMPIRDELY
jgi:hypothetical protein